MARNDPKEFKARWNFHQGSKEQPPGATEWARAGFFWRKARKAREAGDKKAYREARRSWLRWRVAALNEGYLPKKLAARILAKEEARLLERVDRLCAAKERGDLQAVREIEGEMRLDRQRAERRARFAAYKEWMDSTALSRAGAVDPMGMFGVVLEREEPDPEYGE